jgi:hypothetical protein
MLQIQLQMVQHGAAVSATNNESPEHTKNDWNWQIGRDEDGINKIKIWLYHMGLLGLFTHTNLLLLVPS